MGESSRPFQRIRRSTRGAVIGIDVSKACLDVHVHGRGKAWTVANTRTGLQSLLAQLPQPVGRVVLEATGACEQTALNALCSAGFVVVRQSAPSTQPAGAGQRDRHRRAVRTQRRGARAQGQHPLRADLGPARWPPDQRRPVRAAGTTQPRHNVDHRHAQRRTLRFRHRKRCPRNGHRHLRHRRRCSALMR